MTITKSMTIRRKEIIKKLTIRITIRRRETRIFKRTGELTQRILLRKIEMRIRT